MKFSITTGAARPSITVAGVALLALSPYSEGHPLSANEAAVLNQTLAENLRNNFASTVREHLTVKDAEGKESLREATDGDKKELQAKFDKYITEYEFGVRRTAARIVDPVEREAVSIATASVKAALAKAGHKLGEKDGEVGKAQFAKLVEQLAAREDVRKEAARRVKATQGLALDGLGL